MKDDLIEPKTELVVEELGETVSVGSDDALLLSMGKKPELKRVYNFWTCKCGAREAAGPD